MSDSGARILVIDDDKRLRKMLRISLPIQHHAVIEAATGQEGIEAAVVHQPDLILLDLGLPDMSGVDVIRELREWTSIPIIVLSVRNEESQKVLALDAGADDYVTKPFSVGELSARMRVALRRVPEPESIFETGHLRVDLARRLVHAADRLVLLTPREYDLLKVLVMHAGKVITQNQLMRDVWGPEHHEPVHVLRVHMSHLRAKIEPDPTHPQVILTEQGVGYRLQMNDERALSRVDSAG
jgi:two-component system KDP operon response regulator KdpE